MKKIILVSLIISMLILSVVLVACSEPLAGQAIKRSKTVNTKDVTTPNTKVPTSGVAQTPSSLTSCSDTDLSNDFFIRGKVTLSSFDKNTGTSKVTEEKLDYCDTDNSVSQLSCDNTQTTILTYTAPCPNNGVCKNGACYSCTDTDGGLNINIKGSAGGGEYDDEKGVMLKPSDDKCVSNLKVREWYCEKGIGTYQELDCPKGSGCFDGACAQVCMDGYVYEKPVGDKIYPRTLGTLSSSQADNPENYVINDPYKMLYLDGNNNYIAHDNVPPAHMYFKQDVYNYKITDTYTCSIDMSCPKGSTNSYVNYYHLPINYVSEGTFGKSYKGWGYQFVRVDGYGCESDTSFDGQCGSDFTLTIDNSKKVGAKTSQFHKSYYINCQRKSNVKTPTTNYVEGNQKLSCLKPSYDMVFEQYNPGWYQYNIFFGSTDIEYTCGKK